VGYSTVKLDAVESVLGWSSKWTTSERLLYGAKQRVRAQVPSGWVTPVRYWHYVFRDGMRALDRYFSGEADEFPSAAIEEMSWMLTHGREIGGARLVFDARNCIRICEVVALVYALDAHLQARR
jgi:hypothetical protein